MDNAYSLLDASDLVFVDAPGTGFSRIAGKDKEKAFWGTDPDAYAFGEFVMGFLSKYGRWNSPKYLFGESYGTPRSAILVNSLTTEHDIDFNGVILLSQILNFDLSADGPELNPGTDEAYIVSLPTYAASAWYHNRLPGGRPADLEVYLREVEQFANGEYASALQAGTELDDARRQAVAAKLAAYTGLPVAYVLKADLRINGGMFEKNLQDASGLTTGRARHSILRPRHRSAVEGDRLRSAIGRDQLGLCLGVQRLCPQDAGLRRRSDLQAGDRVFKSWSFQHQPPGQPFPVPGALNVMPDLAYAMKYDPALKVMVNGGYYDLATPFYEGWYEMHHLQIPATLQSNIEYHYYPSGHMVYAHEDSLKALHDNVASFIRRTDNLAH